MPFSIATWLMRTRIDAHVRLSGKPMEHRCVSNPYHAVGVVPASGCCKAVAELKGRRFLSATAPKLPLPACDAASCRCRFMHFEDRREGEDRRERTMDARGHSMPDRRRSRGNRATD
jgi:hypothetical protein